MSIPTPFGHPSHQVNSRQCRAGVASCAWCGMPVKEPWRYAVRIIESGARLAERDAPNDGRGEMGCHPVGDRCAEELSRQGVPVFKW